MSVLGELGVIPLAAHLFIFYFGMMSMVTPPVALAGYASASIAEAPIMKTSFAAFRFSLVGFALPFAFVLRPELIMLTPENTDASVLMIAANVLTTIVGICGLAAAIAGYAFRSIVTWQRILLLVMSLAVFLTRWQDTQFIIHLVCVLLISGLLLMNLKGSKPSEQPELAA